MVDSLTVAERSALMSRIRGKDSAPELRLRRLVHGLGFRYRLHVAALPGKPDLVFVSRRAVIFMHGCFWHRHEHCPNARLPKSNVEFWINKLEENSARDARMVERLEQAGWRVMIVWECELSDLERVASRVKTFLAHSEGEAT
jgi:DNA mismatch endonuclease (patch repair protein)